ncbi:MAG: MipA/OmpV family protein [Gammaproteobacteria bacterium]|nr:MipA/OmpV family protein [Gammaproteobacteria bacterium]
MTLIAALLSLCLPPAAQAQHLPLWEAGVGMAAIHFPSYRGSAVRQDYLLPAPYVYYRGRYLQIGREDVRSMLFRSERAQFYISLGGEVPVRSQDNPLRRGMPDLDTTVEIGPTLEVALARSQRYRTDVDLRFSVAPVLATDLTQIHAAGWLFQPQLAIDSQDIAGISGLQGGLRAGPLFADQRYHQYYYGVDEVYARPDRAAYRARGGYAGSQLTVALNRRFDHVWAGGFLRWDDLDGATFIDSPLVETRSGFTAGFALSWILFESAARATDE